MTAPRARHPAGYLRVSSDEQTGNLSLPTQRRAIVDYCARQDWPEPVIYEDAGKSAFNDDLARRPQFAALVSACEAARHDVVIVTDLDRLARNTSLALLVADRLTRAGTTIISLNQNGSFETPDGRLFYTLSSGFAEFASSQIARKTRAGLDHIRASGGYVGGLPFGARRDASYRLVVDEERASDLALLLELAAHNSYNRVAEELNRRAVRPPKRARAWRDTTVRSVVLHATWLLEQPGRWPALAASALSRPRLARGSGAKTQRTLTGLMRCACGGTVVYSGYNLLRSGERVYGVQCRDWSMARPSGYHCPIRKRAALHYEAEIERWLLSLPDLSSVRPPESRDLDGLRADLRERRQLLGLALVDRTLDRATYQERLTALNAEEASLPLVEIDPVREGALVTRAQSLWPLATGAERNAILRALIERAIVDGPTIRPVPVPSLAVLLDALV